jgi:Spy/CpxP family protein refolding chaperone
MRKLTIPDNRSLEQAKADARKRVNAEADAAQRLTPAQARKFADVRGRGAASEWAKGLSRGRDLADTVRAIKQEADDWEAAAIQAEVDRQAALEAIDAATTLDELR